MLRLIITFLVAFAAMASALVVFSSVMYVLFVTVGNPTAVIVLMVSVVYGFAVAFLQYANQREKL